MESFGFLCVCISRDYGAASVMANSIITFWNLSCGFLINPGIPLFPLPPFSFLPAVPSLSLLFIPCSLLFSDFFPFLLLPLNPSTTFFHSHSHCSFPPVHCLIFYAFLLFIFLSFILGRSK